jgi:hypothetical protein
MPPAENSRSIFDTLFGCCLGHRRQSVISSRNDEHGEASTGNGVDERTPLLGAKGRQNDVDAGSKGETSGLRRRSSAELGVDKRAISRKRRADAARLRAIRDQANDAFFYIDNSQLLPSSSSARPLHNDLKRDAKADASLHHQELVAESDKAERLYKAAMISEDAENLALSPEEREAPLSIVRQMKVTVREAAAKGDSSASTATIPERNPSSSPVEAHARMGLAVSEDRQIDHSMNKFPSLHSLRTLRLGPRRSFGSSSNSTESEKLSPRDVNASGADDDGEWARGRTRSKRGLVWIDSGQTDQVEQQSKPKVHEIFQDQKDQSPEIEAKAKIAEDEVSNDAVSLRLDETNQSPLIKVPNALRLSSKQSETMRDVQERLKASTSIAEVWDSSQDT